MPQGPFNTLVAKILGSTAYSALSLGKQSDLLKSDLHGGKYTQAYQSNLFWGANQVGATLSSGLATTYVGLCLSNPAASTKNLVIRKVTGTLVVAPAAVAALGLIVGYVAAGVVTHTTALGIQSSLYGVNAPTSQAKVDAACTIVGTPTWNRMLASSTLSASLTRFSDEVDGGIVLQPGSYCAIGSFGAAGPTAGLMGSFEWEEVSP